MRIPISPQEIVNAVVGNNPAAVQENMVRSGLVQSSSVVTTESFMVMLSNLSTDSRAQAVSLIANLFNIQIDNNGYAAQWLYQMTTNYGMSLEQLTSTIFDAYLPQELPQVQLQGENAQVISESGSGCGCSKGKLNKPMKNAAAPITSGSKTLGIVVLGLAVFGLLTLIALSVRVLQKLAKI
jgi:hypothetical protein